MFAFGFRGKAIPTPAAATSSMSWWNSLPSVQTTSRVRLSVSVLLLLVLLLLQAQAHLFAAVLAQTSSSFLCVSFQKMSSSFFWRSSVDCANTDSFLRSFSSLFVMKISLITAYCFSWHLHMRSWVSGSFPHAGNTSHATLHALNEASHVPLMCIVISCPRCHCVSCLDLNKCRDAAVSIPLDAIIPSLASLTASLKSRKNFLSSPLMRDIFVVFQADREGILPRRLHPLQALCDLRNQARGVV